MKNCLLVTIDSLRFDYLDPEDAPTITRLADEGTSFERAFATGPGTTSSFPAILTGTLPLSYDGLGPLSERRPRVAERLRDKGFTTAGFQCNPFLSRHFNYDRGFDSFEDYQNPLMGIATRLFPRGIELNNPKFKRADEYLHLTDAIKKTYQIVKGKPRPYVSAEVVTEDAASWLRDCHEPFFCWTHYMDVHHPCYPPVEYRERYAVEHVSQSEIANWYSMLLTAPKTLSKREIDALRNLYRAAIAYTDAQVGRLMTTLEASDTLDETIIIITSDHGELFGEHDVYGKPERMYDELLRVPLVVVNGPDTFSYANDDLVSLLDVPLIIHNALDLNVPDTYEGHCLGTDEPREHVIAEHEVEGKVVVGARSSDWLYEHDEIHDEHRLCDLRNGFKQVSVAIAEEEAGADHVRDVVQSRLDKLNMTTQTLEEEVEGDIQRRLEDLGYL